MEDSKNMMAIYGLFDSRSPDEVRYMGRTGDPGIRLRSHVSARKRSSTQKDKWVGNVVSDGGFIDAYVIEWVELRVSRYAEAYWIKTLDAIGHNLTNTYRKARPLRPRSMSQYKTDVLFHPSTAPTVKRASKLLETPDVAPMDVESLRLQLMGLTSMVKGIDARQSKVEVTVAAMMAKGV